MIMMAMTSRHMRKQFIEVLLSTLERNRIYVPTHTTIALLVDRIRHHREDFESEFGEQTDINTYKLYLMRYHPFTGFTQDPEPTSIEYGICQGCKDHMPVNARCTRVINAGFFRPLQFCVSPLDQRWNVLFHNIYERRSICFISTSHNYKTIVNKLRNICFR